MFTSRISAGLAISLLLSGNIAFAEESLPTNRELEQMTRADFTQMIVKKLFTEEEMKDCFQRLSPSIYQLLFIDVSVHESYANELCMAMRYGLVRGYQDGYFRPNQPINFAESSKVITRAFSLSPAAGHNNFSPWYKGYVEALESRGAIPRSVRSFDQKMTYLVAEEIIDRIVNDKTYMDSGTYESLSQGA